MIKENSPTILLDKWKLNLLQRDVEPIQAHLTQWHKHYLPVQTHSLIPINGNGNKNIC